MDKVDRLINKAQEAFEPDDDERLRINNPYLGKTSDELLDYLSGDNYRAPDRRTFEWAQFMHALMHAPCGGGGLIE